MANHRIISMVGREIAGYHKNLHRGFDELGIENHFFFERSHPFYSHEKPRTRLEIYITKLNDMIVEPNNGKVKKIVLFFCLYPLVVFLKWLLFPYFLKKYDVFIFGANYSFLGFYLDRVILKLMGKKIVGVTTGSDVRPPYLNGHNSDVSTHQLYFMTALKFLVVRTKNYFSDFIIDHPGVSHFNTKKYISFLYVGFPFSMDVTEIKSDNRKKPLIIHAPSKPKIKGTDIIRDVVKELQAEGYNFDYEELIGVSHDTVMQKISECLFVMNELYSDTLMAGLDTEAGWLGKPSVIGGSNFKMLEEGLDGNLIAPTYRIEPTKESVKNTFIHFLNNPKEAKKLGRDAQEFIQKHWTSKEVARKYLEMLEGKTPEKYIRNPKDDYDIWGCGMRDTDRKRTIKNLIDTYGDGALFLNDKPELKQKLIESVT